MANPYTQKNRIGELFTPFEYDKLLLTRFDGTEGISELFEFRIEALSVEENYLNFDEALGKHCSVSIKTIDGGKRWFDGILTETQCLGLGNGGIAYRLVLRPWFWVLSRRLNSKIFANVSVPKIITEIFGKHAGLMDFDNVLSKDYPDLEYCVQYRESDMDFVCRLMEENGISYHFVHTQGAHKLVMGDGVAAWKTISRNTRPFIPLSDQHQGAEEHFFDWVPERRFTIGQTTLKHYDFKHPGSSLLVTEKGDAKYEHAQQEDYDYPGRHLDEKLGHHYAKARIDAERAEDQRFMASGDCVSCAPGMLVTLTRHTSEDQNKEYLALRCTHSLVSESFRSGGGQDIEEAYQGSYEFMRSNRNYAPPQVTEKPYVFGPQTAKVVGEQDIPCDEYGRVQVQFHWDREPAQSMPCRVSQLWASKEWGTMFIPRKGMEVIVEFLEGDPDQPIIVGCVYNADNMPPYKLGGMKNIAGFKSNTTEGKSGGGGYNEFILDDTKGKEVIRTHAQYDIETTALHDETRTIKNNRTSTITKNDKLTVHGDSATRVDHKITIDAGDSITITVKGVGGDSQIFMDGNKISLSAKTVEIKAKMLFSSESDAISKHSAGALMSIDGKLVKINS